MREKFSSKRHMFYTKSVVVSNMLLQDIFLATIFVNITDDYPNLSEKYINFYNDLYKIGGESIRNKTFNVVTIHYPPISYLNRDKGSGVAFTIFDAMQERFQFKYEIVQKEEDTMVSISEVLDKYENQTDIAVAVFPVNGKINKNMKYSVTIGSIQWHVLMKRPKLSANGSGLLQPFTWEVWILVVITLLVVGVIMFGLAFVQSKFEKRVDKKTFSLPSCMWFVYGAILKQGSTLNPITDSLRIIFATWWIFIMILTAFYTANLTAFLTLNTFTLPISEIRDIGKKGYTWCTQVNAFDNTTNDPTEELSKALVGSTKKVINNSITAKVLKSYIIEKNYLFIAEKPLIDIWLYKDYVETIGSNSEDIMPDCPYAVTDWSLLATSIAFAYSKQFAYSFILDKALQHLVEAGLINFWFRSMLPRTQICPLNPKVNERRLRNSDLMLTYYIVAFGFAIATIFFCAELVNKVIKKRRHERIVMIPQNTLFTKSPPPPYSSLYEPPFANNPNYNVKRKEINGRDYWCVTSNNSKKTKLIPVRAPSAVLFNYTKY